MALVFLFMETLRFRFSFHIFSFVIVSGSLCVCAKFQGETYWKRANFPPNLVWIIEFWWYTMRCSITILFGCLVRLVFDFLISPQVIINLINGSFHLIYPLPSSIRNALIFSLLAYIDKSNITVCISSLKWKTIWKMSHIWNTERIGMHAG